MKISGEWWPITGPAAAHGLHYAQSTVEGVGVSVTYGSGPSSKLGQAYSHEADGAGARSK